MSMARSLTTGVPPARNAPLGQWLALSGKYQRQFVRSGELFIATVAPLIFTLGYYVPLRRVMEVSGLDYAQFLMPIIALQTLAFTATSAAMRAARDSQEGLTTRLHTMPVWRVIPIAGRLSVAVVRSVVSLTAALIFGHLIGFRFLGDPVETLCFLLLVYAIGLTFCVGGEALGALSANPQAASQALTLPVLILGMLSTGFIPESGFPEWIRPFVRNQPISQFAETLRSMTDGQMTWESTWVSLAWVGGLAVALVSLALWSATRRK